MEEDRKKTWRQKARMYLAEAFGGKCTICGYDKTIAALDYHHVDSKEKDRLLSAAMRNGAAWSKIAEEARKCTIVCCRCHREIHAGVAELPANYAKFDEKYADIIKLRKKELNKCPICMKLKNRLRNYCSKECADKALVRVNISREELERLTKDKPYVEIGRMFGISDSAVRKKCKVLGIEMPPKRGYWSKKRL